MDYPRDTLLRRSAVVLAAGAVVWLFLAFAVVPEIIVQAHEGQSWTWLNEVFASKRKHAVTAYVTRWMVVTWTVASMLLLSAWVCRQATNREWLGKALGQATPGNLGAIRMLVCAMLLANTVWEDLPSVVHLPREVWTEHGTARLGVMRFMEAWPAFADFRNNEAALRWFKAATAVVLGLGMVGLGTRWVLPLAASLLLIQGGILRECTHLFHTCLVAWYVLVALCFVRCADGWSLDRFIHIARGEAVVPSGVATPYYAGARWICWFLVALPYFGAGFSKLYNGGWGWTEPVNLRNILITDSLNPMEFSFNLGLVLAQWPDWVLRSILIATIVIEGFYFLVLFQPQARFVFPLFAAGMHLGIFLCQNVLFFDLMIIQLVFLDGTAVRNWTRRWSGKRVEVLYDGFCPLCSRTVKILAAMDLFRRITFLNFRALDLAAFNAERGLSLQPDDLVREMHVLRGRRVEVGFAGYRVMVWQLPGCWWTLPLLYFPGVPQAGKLVYSIIAARRPIIPQCDAACALIHPSAHTPESPAVGVTPKFVWGATGGVVLFFLTFMGAWLARSEFYPWSAWQMYAATSGPVVTYYKLWGVDAAGRRHSFRPDRAIGALSDGRFMDHVPGLFSPQRESLARQVMAAALNHWNTIQPPPAGLVSVEVERWRWNIIAHGAIPARGQLVDTISIPSLSAPLPSRRNN